MKLLIDPMAIFWLLLIAVAIAKFFARPILYRVLIVLTGLWLFIIYVSPLPLWLAFQLEKRYPVFQQTQLPETTAVHVLVLGGGHTIAPHLPPLMRLERSALGRLVEGIRIHRKFSQSKLICSGSSISNTATQAELLALSALAMGVSPGDTATIRTAKNTEEEARDYFKRYGKCCQLILVTSAVHMPRAMKVFRNTGLQPLAAPVNHFVKSESAAQLWDFTPSLRKIQIMKKAMQELTANIWIEVND